MRRLLIIIETKLNFSLLDNFLARIEAADRNHFEKRTC